MIMQTSQSGAVTVVTLSGEVDLSHSPNLRKVLMDLMLDKKAVVVELSGVSYIDSSGVAGLVEAYQMARKNGSPFTLAALADPVRRVLQLARLDRVFTIADTLEAALK
ncbi:anti-sigma factor antagonist [Paramagnetospirillum kuznetsovii]|uniref:Anti-sigma factor antagonist n=1 Tax=Paramagnetospirillum kuznetsovii TaxID=2053833 RepID=A0A364NX92_9PROT|nr:STAS domain-containing protein [Paramagnetospirillum kuznetsovii]RAU21704.1 anti-sigma factor antagonist [Paramagnetospirillum kuznetsovii]